MFQKALANAIKKLAKSKAHGYLEDFALIGGFAVARWSRPRATADIDFIIRLGEANLEDLVRQLKGQLNKGDLQDPLMATIVFEEHDKKGRIPVQLVIFPPAWEEVAFDKIHLETVGSMEIPFVDWKALVLLKIYAGSALDFEDARSIIDFVKPSKRDKKNLKKRAERLRVSSRLKRIL